MFDTEYPHTRLIGELHDKCNDSLLAFVDLIDGHLADVDYAKLWPSLHDLIALHGLPVPDAMHVLRRVIHMQRIQGNDEWRAGEERRRKEELDTAKPEPMTDDSSAPLLTRHRPSESAVHQEAAAPVRSPARLR